MQRHRHGRRGARTGARLALVAAGLGIACLVGASEPSAFELVTPAERDRAGAASAPADDGALIRKAGPGAPTIVLRAPADTAVELVSPVDIEIAFEAADGADIDMSSLRVYYDGFLRLDVTDRILEHAEIVDGVVRAADAALPAGDHEFVIEIRDALGRTAERAFRVRVAG